MTRTSTSSQWFWRSPWIRLLLCLSAIGLFTAPTRAQDDFLLLRSVETYESPYRRSISPDGYVVWEQKEGADPWRAYQSRPGSAPALIVQADDPVPGRPGLSFTRFGFESWPGPGGRVLFRTQVAPIGDVIRQGMFLFQSNRISTVALGGDRVPGHTDLWFSTSLNILPFASFASNGDCALLLPVSENPADFIGTPALFSISEGQVQMVLRAGASLPDHPSEKINHLDAITMTPQLGLMVLGNLQSPISDWDCLWQLKGTHLTPLIQFDRRLDGGTPAPGTDNRRFANVELGPEASTSGTIAFTASTLAAGQVHGATLSGLWAGPPDRLELRVRPGAPFTGPLSGTLLSVASHPVPASNNAVLFTGRYQTEGDNQPRFGLFRSEGAGKLELVISPGAQAPGLDPSWHIEDETLEVLSSFAEGRFLVSCRVRAEGDFSWQGLLVLDERSRWRPIIYGRMPLIESGSGDTIQGIFSTPAGWENGLGQRRLVTEGGLMVLPLFGTTINGVFPKHESLYFVQLKGGTSRLTPAASTDVSAGPFLVAAQVEPGKAYHWEWAPALHGPWTHGELFWAGDATRELPWQPDEGRSYLRLVSP